MSNTHIHYYQVNDNESYYSDNTKIQAHLRRPMVLGFGEGRGGSGRWVGADPAYTALITTDKHHKGQHNEDHENTSAFKCNISPNTIPG